MRKLYIVILFMVMLLSSNTFTLVAAPAELSVTARTKLEQVIANADSKLAKQLQDQLTALHAKQEQDLAWERTIKAVHYQNETDLIRVRKQIKVVDADKLSKLHSQVQTLKSRYQPLFDSYSALNRQIDLAKILKNKTINSTLRSQANVMKIAVQLARKDIRNKEDIHKKAKAESTKKIQQLRDSLSAIEPIKVKIRAEQSRMNTPKQRFTSEWKVYQSAIKKGDAKSIIRSLTSLTSFATVVNDHKIKIYNYEKSINDILHRVEARIP
jgi:hypothetical protein